MVQEKVHRGGWAALGLVFTLYRIDCLANGKGYIGVTGGNIVRRWKHHVWAAMGGRRDGPLSRAIRKYGAESFSIRAIETTHDMFAAQSRERALILAHNTLAPIGMNATTGGELLIGIVRSKGTRQKHGDATRGRKLSPEHRAKISAANLGRVHTAATIAKMSFSKKGTKPAPQTIAASVAARVGKPLTANHVAKMILANMGRKRSEESKKKMSLAAKKRGISEETRTKMAKPRSVRWNLSPETRARQSAAQRARFARERVANSITLEELAEAR